MSILGSILIMLLTLCFVCLSLVLERAMEKEETEAKKKEALSCLKMLLLCLKGVTFC